jgi:nicotinamidase-related amidase
MNAPSSSRLITRDESLLVVIDIQERLLPVIDQKDEILANARKLATFARLIGLPALTTRQEKLGATMAGLAEDLGPVPDFEKITFDCFGLNSFRSHLELGPWTTLILCGIETHICVAQTALTALDQYRVHIVTDAVGSRDPRNKDVALRRLESAGAVLTSTEMVIYELLGRAGTPEFKDALKLVK